MFIFGSENISFRDIEFNGNYAESPEKTTGVIYFFYYYINSKRLSNYSVCTMYKSHNTNFCFRN